MKELSIFVDESGDFGEYNHRTPYYIISMVLVDTFIRMKKGMAFLTTSVVIMRLYVNILVTLSCLVNHLSLKFTTI